MGGLAVKSVGDPELETDQNLRAAWARKVGDCPLLGWKEQFASSSSPPCPSSSTRPDPGMTLVPLALEKGPRRDKCNAFRLSFLPSVGSLSVVRLVPCVCDRKPPKKVWTFFGALSQPGSVGSQMPCGLLLIRRKQPRNAERLCGWPATMPGDGMPGTVQFPSTALSSSGSNKAWSFSTGKGVMGGGGGGRSQAVCRREGDVGDG